MDPMHYKYLSGSKGGGVKVCLWVCVRVGVTHARLRAPPPTTVSCTASVGVLAVVIP